MIVKGIILITYYDAFKVIILLRLNFSIFSLNEWPLIQRSPNAFLHAKIFEYI